MFFALVSSFGAGEFFWAASHATNASASSYTTPRVAITRLVAVQR